jgi:hypothetical protein
MKTSHILSLLALSGLLAACATPKSNAQLRKAYFKTLPNKNAELDTILSKRDPANCEAEEGEVTREAQPLVRIPPIMPMGANTSGSCDMQFDVNKAGQTVNIKTLSCTDDIYDYASRRALSLWKYNPRVMNGELAGECGIENTIKFQLIDERGKVI